MPASDLRGPAYTITVPATAYNSLPWQTDDTPFITASGTTTRHGVLAANFLPIGTRVKIPEIYGDDIFIVEDRMNSRYWERVDIWMEEYDDAIEFGYQNINIEVYPNQ
ncbi:3D domain-containing protein [Candidatus Uhrbacteria bacterium]|nr:3D domain-containing protein [Candidatus Uhrbacteria bacterium]MBT7717164.1 3D domain-containing protein [Candidatus Uhrbacteria bacterium]